MSILRTFLYTIEYMFGLRDARERASSIQSIKLSPKPFFEIHTIYMHLEYPLLPLDEFLLEALS